MDLPITKYRLIIIFSMMMIIIGGCARFNDAQSDPFTSVPHGEMLRPPSSPPPPLPAHMVPKACPASGVMQGCLESTSGLIMNLDSKSALVAERTTGIVKEVSIMAEPKIRAAFQVDPSGDGGLMDIALSPTYAQDRLMYAYISTPTDNRVVRIADNDVPKEILTGIPKGSSGNMGALLFTSKTTLMVMTGNAGNPALAIDPNSRAGKLLRLEQPTTVGQAAPTTALAGLGSAGGLCRDSSDGSLYVVDRSPTADRLQRIDRNSHVSTVWTWPNKPGVGGCAALDGIIVINLVNTKQTVAVHVNPQTGLVSGNPDVIRQDTHGHAWAVRMSPDGNLWGATVNKTAGDPTKTDDVVFPLMPHGGGFSRIKDDVI